MKYLNEVSVSESSSPIFMPAFTLFKEKPHWWWKSAIFEQVAEAVAAFLLRHKFAEARKENRR